MNRVVLNPMRGMLSRRFDFNSIGSGKRYRYVALKNGIRTEGSLKEVAGRVGMGYKLLSVEINKISEIKHDGWSITRYELEPKK